MNQTQNPTVTVARPSFRNDGRSATIIVEAPIGQSFETTQAIAEAKALDSEQVVHAGSVGPTALGRGIIRHEFAAFGA